MAMKSTKDFKFSETFISKSNAYHQRKIPTIQIEEFERDVLKQKKIWSTKKHFKNPSKTQHLVSANKNRIERIENTQKSNKKPNIIFEQLKRTAV